MFQDAPSTIRDTTKSYRLLLSLLDRTLLLPGFSMSSGAIDATLEGAQNVLDTAGSFVELANIPGLSQAVKAVAHVIHIITKMRKNSKVRRQMEEHLVSLAFSLSRTVEDIRKRCEKESLSMDALRMPPELDSRINGLIRSLSDIAQKLSDMRTGSRVGRFLGVDRDADKLSYLKEQLRNAQRDFELQGQIRIEFLVDAMFGTLHTIQQDISVLVQFGMTTEIRETLSKLPHVVDAGYRSNRHEHKAHLMHGTRADILREIYEWATEAPKAPKHLIHVLSGAAGTGKSTIAYEVARCLDEEGKLGASFFFDRGSEALATTRFVFTTIAYQLALQQPMTIAHYFVDAIQSYLQRGRDQQMEFALDELIIRPLESKHSERPVVLVIDAVDECTESGLDLVPRMLYLLAERVSAAHIPFRILITTRPEYHIEDVLQSADFSKDSSRIRLQDIPRNIVDGDIQHFLEHSFRKIPRIAPFLAAHPDTISALTMKAEGLFVYASTVVKLLRHDAEHTNEIVDELLGHSTSHSYSDLEQLDRLYIIVLRNAFQKFDRYADSIHAVLGCIALLQDHLTPSAIASLMGISIANTLFVVNRLTSVIFSEGGSDEEKRLLRPLHASFPQFLIDPHRCTELRFHVDPGARHECIAVACFSVMLNHLHYNILELTDPMTPKSSIAELHALVELHLPSHVQYACAHWAFHLCRASCTVDLLSMLEAFVSQKVLYWMEALSHMGRMDRAPRALLDVRSWCQRQRDGPNDTFDLLLRDAHRFLLEYFDAINICPEHIYISGLSTMPSCPLLEICGNTASAKLVQMVTPRPAQWGSHIRIIESPDLSYRVLRYSPDGRWILASAYTSVQCYHALSGDLFHTISGVPEMIHDLDVSSDGSTLVTLAYAMGVTKQYIQVWNFASGALLHSIEYDNVQFLALSFSQDGRRILGIARSRSAPTSIVPFMWDTRTFTMIRFLGTRELSNACSHNPYFSWKRDFMLETSDDKALQVVYANTLHQGKARGSISVGEDYRALFLPDRDDEIIIYTSSWIRIVDVRTMQSRSAFSFPLALSVHTMTIGGISPSGDHVALIGDSRKQPIFMLELKMGRIYAVSDSRGIGVKSLCFAPDESCLACLDQYSSAIHILEFALTNVDIVAGEGDTVPPEHTRLWWDSHLQVTTVSACDNQVGTAFLSQSDKGVRLAVYHAKIDVSRPNKDGSVSRTTTITTGERVWSLRHDHDEHNTLEIRPLCFSNQGDLLAIDVMDTYGGRLELLSVPELTTVSQIDPAPSAVARRWSGAQFSQDDASLYLKQWRGASGEATYVYDRKGGSWVETAQQREVSLVFEIWGDGWVSDRRLGRRIIWLPKRYRPMDSNGYNLLCGLSALASNTILAIEASPTESLVILDISGLRFAVESL